VADERKPLEVGLDRIIAEHEAEPFPSLSDKIADYVRGRMAVFDHGEGLTERELEVIQLVARGLTNKEIATSLGMATKTAGNHLQHIFEKTGVTTRAAATMYAMQHGLL